MPWHVERAATGALLALGLLLATLWGCGCGASAAEPANTVPGDATDQAVDAGAEDADTDTETSADPDAAESSDADAADSGLADVIDGGAWISLAPSSGSVVQGTLLETTVTGKPGGYADWFWIRASLAGNGISQGEADTDVWFSATDASTAPGADIASTMSVKALYEPGTYTLDVTMYFKDSTSGATWSASAPYTFTVTREPLNVWNGNPHLVKDGTTDFDSAMWDFVNYCFPMGSATPTYQQSNPTTGPEALQSIRWQLDSSTAEDIVQLSTKDIALNTFGCSAYLGQGGYTNHSVKALPALNVANKLVVMQGDVRTYGSDFVLAPSWTGQKMDVWVSAPNGRSLYIEMYFVGYGVNDPLAWQTNWPYTGDEVCRVLGGDNGPIYDYMIRISRPESSAASLKSVFNKLVKPDGSQVLFADVAGVIERAISRGKDPLNPWRLSGWDDQWTSSSGFAIRQLEYDLESGNAGMASATWLSTSRLSLMYE